MTEKISFGAASEIGMVRQVNEDSKLHSPPIFAVADGMGGHSAGDVASALAIQTISDHVGDQEEALSSAVKEANRVIFDKAANEPGLNGMGTTVTAMYTRDSSAQIVHVGDSRAYLLRSGELSQLTQDHTVVDQLIRQGRITPEEAANHPQRSRLVRALGVDREVDIDVKVIETMPGDRILLCSDGLHGMIDEELIRQVLLSETDPGDAAKRLTKEAVDAGGHDNVTAIVVDYPGEAPPASARETSPDTAAIVSKPQVQQRPQQRPAVRKSLIWTLAMVLILGALAVGARYILAHSWYVGEQDHRVAVFTGIPEQVGGFSVSKVDATTDISIASLPQYWQSRVHDGVKATDRADADSIIANLRKISASTTAPAPASATNTATATP